MEVGLHRLLGGLGVRQKMVGATLGVGPYVGDPCWEVSKIITRPGSRWCVPIIRRYIPGRRKCNKGWKMGKNGVSEREEGNSKMGCRSPPGAGKRAKKILKSV